MSVLLIRFTIQLKDVLTVIRAPHHTNASCHSNHITRQITDLDQRHYHMRRTIVKSCQCGTLLILLAASGLLPQRRRGKSALVAGSRSRAIRETLLSPASVCNAPATMKLRMDLRTHIHITLMEIISTTRSKVERAIRSYPTSCTAIRKSRGVISKV